MCEILGLDPLCLANEGMLVLFVLLKQVGAALTAMRVLDVGKNTIAIGTAISENPGTVVMKTVFGGGRILDMLVGEQLPRIC